MTGVQKFFLGILPRCWAKSIEAESREWRYRCPCGFERSCWEAGGIRWKAMGKSCYLLKCPCCGETTWHVAYKSDASNLKPE